MNDNGRLEAVLAEYKAMREEIIGVGNKQVQIYYIWIGFIGVFLGLVLGNNSSSIPGSDVLLILPAFSSIFAFRYLWEYKVIRMVSDYMYKEIEEIKIVQLLGKIPRNNRKKEEYNDYGKYPIGWQHWYDTEKTGKYTTTYWAFSFVILMAISFGIPILYSLLILEKENFLILCPPLIPTLISIIIFYIPFIVAIYNILIKKYKKLLIKKYKKREEIILSKWDYGIFSTPLGIILLLTVFLFLDKYYFIKILNSLLVCLNKIPSSIFSPQVHWVLVWIYLTLFCVIIVLFLREKPEQRKY